MYRLPVLMVTLFLFLNIVFKQALSAPQTYPSRPVRMVVPVAAGGTTDIMGRIIAAKLMTQFQQQFVIDDRPGASGMIGADIVAKAQPDGHTLLLVGGSFGTLRSLFTKLPFDVEKDFAPVSFFATSPYVLVVQPDLPVRNVLQLISYGKSNPGRLNFAGSTPGSLQRLAGEYLKYMGGFDMTYVAYRGTGALMPDLIGGRLQVAFDNVLILAPYIQKNTLRALGVTGLKRSSVMPQIATVAESGLPGFSVVGWFGVLATGGTPERIVQTLNRAINQAMQDTDIKERFQSQGSEPLTGSPADLRAHLVTENAKWGKLIRELGVKAD